VHSEAGSVFAEYVVLLVLVSLGCVAASVALGPPLLKLYLTQRAVLLVPYPL
jgi:Flp pilus assembly pilin Flp